MILAYQSKIKWQLQVQVGLGTNFIMRNLDCQGDVIKHLED